MKRDSNSRSRRSFLKAAGPLAIASAFSEKSMDAAETELSGNPPNRETTTERLGEIADQPPDSAFKMRRRMPGWRPDTRANGTIKFFPEEALERIKNTGKFRHFPVPATDKAFKEPREGSTDKDWLDFYEWILGQPITGGSEFDNFLREIANSVRRYNAALYWMRRLHFAENTPNSDAPPRNPHGCKDLPDPADPTKPRVPLDASAPGFDFYVTAAERVWKRATNELNDILGGATTDLFTDIVADMVEVNGYIVSMRVIANDKTAQLNAKARRNMQIGGSSSSHVLISSAFSSSAP